MAAKITFYKGEKRNVTATITSRNIKEAVVINSATFELINTDTKQVVQSGTCEHKGNEAVAFLDLSAAGHFELVVTSQVGREEIISKCPIDVE
jgi:hypothetical protein